MKGPATGGLRRAVGLLVATVVLPLLVVALGLWERSRGAVDAADVAAEQLRLERVVAELERRMPKDGSIDFGLQFRRGGQTYAGPLALAEARRARDDAAMLERVMRARTWLPPVVIGAAGASATLSVLLLLAGIAFGALGRFSREILVRSFAALRVILPWALAVQVVCGTAAFVALTVFEAAALAEARWDAGAIKLLLVALALIGGSLFVAGSALLGLRRTLSALSPDPLVMLGRTVTRAEAPGLWSLVETLAGRLGALAPDAIVVGLGEGFSASGGPKLLRPSGRALVGRTLFVPLPHLVLMPPAQVASIIGHELAHFAGGDVAYTLRFLPIYAGVTRSLDAVNAAGAGAGSLFGLLSPALPLGRFLMERFHLAVRRWSRSREFAADRAGAGPTSPEAAALALLRTGAVEPRIAGTLRDAADHARTAPDDLVAAVLERVLRDGLDDPASHLDVRRPHPTDTHPPTRERVAALGVPLTPALLAEAAALPTPNAGHGLRAYFADPAAICRAASADVLTVIREADEAWAAELAEAATRIQAEDLVLHENTRAGAWALTVVGAVFGVVAIAIGLLGSALMPTQAAAIAAAVMLALGVAATVIGAVRFWRGEPPFLVLAPSGLTVPGLDRPIAWDEIADLDMRFVNSLMNLRLLLSPDVAWPHRVPGGRKVGFDAKRRIVTVRAVLPRKLSPHAFADLLGRYRRAAEARRLLAERDAGP